MATKCSRIFNRSSISTMKSTISNSNLGVSPAAFSKSSLPSKSNSSSIRRFFLSRSPAELGSVASMLPLHSAVAVARMTSCLSSSSRCCRALSQVIMALVGLIVVVTIVSFLQMKLMERDKTFRGVAQ